MTPIGTTRTADAPLILALASGCSVTDAAARANISRRTVFRRLADPRFRAELTRMQREVIDQAVQQARAHLVEGATAAARTLIDLLTGASSESVKLAAARAILDLTLPSKKTYEAAAEDVQTDRDGSISEDRFYHWLEVIHAGGFLAHDPEFVMAYVAFREELAREQDPPSPQLPALKFKLLQVIRHVLDTNPGIALPSM